MLVHVGNCVVICCHFGAFYDCHLVVMLVSCWSTLVIVLSVCCHVVCHCGALVALDDCHCVVIVLRMLVQVGHLVVIVVVIGLPCWCIWVHVDDCQVLAILLAFGCMLVVVVVILLSCCCRFGALDGCHGVVMLL